MRQLSTRSTAVALISAATVIILGCEISEGNVSPDGRSLLGPFRSYQTPSEVAALLQQRNLTWLVIEENALPEGDLRPPFSVVKWSVDSFERGSLVGEAHLVFFNGRLSEIILFPNDPSVLPSEQEARSAAPNSVRVRVDRDYRGKWSISYEDVRLQKEKDAWLRKYS